MMNMREGIKYDILYESSNVYDRNRSIIFY